MQRAKRVAVRTAMMVVALNLWTGSPLLALWLGSRIQPDGAPTMGPIFVVVVAITVFSILLAQALMRLGAAYDRLTGHTATVHRHVPWLRSMRGERPHYADEHVALSGLEQVMVSMVVVAVLAFEIWFFFYSSSPIDQRTGRSGVEVLLAPAGARPTGS
jgi:hypothetical protein